MAVRTVAECDVCEKVVDITETSGWVKLNDFAGGVGFQLMGGEVSEIIVCSKACGHLAIDARPV